MDAENRIGAILLALLLVTAPVAGVTGTVAAATHDRTTQSGRLADDDTPDDFTGGGGNTSDDTNGSSGAGGSNGSSFTFPRTAISYGGSASGTVNWLTLYEFSGEKGDTVTIDLSTGRSHVFTGLEQSDGYVVSAPLDSFETDENVTYNSGNVTAVDDGDRHDITNVTLDYTGKHTIVVSNTKPVTTNVSYSLTLSNGTSGSTSDCPTDVRDGVAAPGGTTGDDACTAEPPTAAFSASETTVTVGETVSFDASASTDNGTITDYGWTFNDGDGAAGETVTHAFDSPGTYVVELIVTDDQGLTNATTRTITVEPADGGSEDLGTIGYGETKSAVIGDADPDEIDAAPTETATFSGAAGDVINVSVTPSGLPVVLVHDGERLVYEFGSITERELPSDGGYAIKVADPGLVDYSGSGPTVSGETPVSVTLERKGGDGSGEDGAEGGSGGGCDVTDGVAAPGGTTGDDACAKPPTADFRAIAVGERVFLDGSLSSDNGTVASYEWALGDGTNAEGVAPTHTYDVGAGTTEEYTVSLTVTDDQGRTNTTTATVTVGPSKDTPVCDDLGSVPLGKISRTELRAACDAVDSGTGAATGEPTAAFRYDPANVTTGATVTFDGTDSTDNGTVATYEWQFGDGTTATGPEPTHAYDTTGEYPVTLTVTDDDGQTNATTRTVSVTAPEKKLVVDADGGPDVYHAIQPAIENASAGAIIEVRPGTYTGPTGGVTSSIELSKTVTLIAPDGATVSGDGGLAAFDIGETAAPTIRGFTVEGFEEGVNARETTGDWTVADLTVRGVDVGVDAAGSTGDWTVTGLDHTGSGTDTGDGVTATNADGDWTVTDSEITNVGTAVAASGTTGAWRVARTDISSVGTGITATGATGDWTVADTAVADAANHPVNARDADGDWTVENLSATNTGRLEAAETDGDWTIRESTLRRTEGIGADATTGDWIVTNSTVADGSFAAVSAEGASGAWTVAASTLTGHERGIDAAGSSAATSGPWTVSNVTVSGMEGVGIDAKRASGFVTLETVTVVKNGGDGITFEGTDGRIEVTGSTVKNNGVAGIDMRGLSDPSAGGPSGIESGQTGDDWTLRTTTVSGNEVYGIRAAGMAGSATFENLTVASNGADGLSLVDATGSWRLADATITGNENVGVDTARTTGEWTITRSTLRGNTIGLLTTDSRAGWTVERTLVTGNENEGIKAAETTGDWTITDSRVTENGVGVMAARSAGDWTLDNVTLARSGTSNLDAGSATGNWTVRGTSNVTGADVKATGTTGEWAIHRTNFRDGAGIDATGAAPAGNARRNWWGSPDRPSNARCRGNVTCLNPLGESASDDATGIEVSLTDESAGTPLARGAYVFVYDGATTPATETRLDDGAEYWRFDEHALIGSTAPTAATLTGRDGIARFTGLAPSTAYCVQVVPLMRDPANVTARCEITVSAENVTTESVTLTNDTSLEHVRDEIAGLESRSKFLVDQGVERASRAYKTKQIVLSDQGTWSPTDVLGVIGVGKATYDLGSKVAKNGVDVTTSDGIDVANEAGQYTFGDALDVNEDLKRQDLRELGVAAADTELTRGKRTAKYALLLRGEEWLWQTKPSTACRPKNDPSGTEVDGPRCIKFTNPDLGGVDPWQPGKQECEKKGEKTRYCPDAGETTDGKPTVEAAMRSLPTVPESSREIDDTGDRARQIRRGESDAGRPAAGLDRSKSANDFDPGAIERVLERQNRQLRGQGTIDGVVITPQSNVYGYNTSRRAAITLDKRYSEYIQNQARQQAWAVFMAGAEAAATYLTGGLSIGATFAVEAGIQVVGMGGDAALRAGEMKLTRAIAQQHANTQIKYLTDVNNLARINDETTGWLEEQYRDPTVGEVDGRIVAMPSFSPDPRFPDGPNVVDANEENGVTHVGTARVAARNSGPVPADARIVVGSTYLADRGSETNGASGVAEPTYQGTSRVVSAAPNVSKPAAELDTGSRFDGRANYSLSDSMSEPFRLHTVHAMLVMDGRVVDHRTTTTYVDIQVPGNEYDPDKSIGFSGSIERTSGASSPRIGVAGLPARAGAAAGTNVGGASGTAVETTTGHAGVVTPVRSDRFAYTTAAAPVGRSVSKTTFLAMEPRASTPINTTLRPGTTASTTVTPGSDTHSVTFMLVAPPSADASLRITDATGRTTGAASNGTDVTGVPDSAYTGSGVASERITVADPAGRELTVTATAAGADRPVPVEVVVMETPKRPAVMGVFPPELDIEAAPGGNRTEQVRIAEVGNQESIEDLTLSVGELTNDAGRTLPASAIDIQSDLGTVAPGRQVRANLTANVSADFDVPAGEPTRFTGTLRLDSSTAGSITDRVSMLVLDTPVENATLRASQPGVTGVHLDPAPLAAVPTVGGEAERLAAYEVRVQGTGTATVELSNASVNETTLVYRVTGDGLEHATLDRTAESVSVRLSAGTHRIVLVQPEIVTRSRPGGSTPGTGGSGSGSGGSGTGGSGTTGDGGVADVDGGIDQPIGVPGDTTTPTTETPTAGTTAGPAADGTTTTTPGDGPATTTAPGPGTEITTSDSSPTDAPTVAPAQDVTTTTANGTTATTTESGDGFTVVLALLSLLAATLLAGRRRR